MNNNLPYWKLFTGLSGTTYQNNELKTAIAVLVYVGLDGVNSTTTILDFIGDGSAARVSNNDINGAYKTAAITFNRSTGTITAIAGSLLAVIAIYNLPLR